MADAETLRSVRVSIHRPREFASMARSYRVLVDGEEVGRLANGRTLRFEVRPGAHRLQVAIDWCSSPGVQVVARPAHPELSFTCGCRYAGWRAFLAWRAIRRHPHDFLWLESQDAARPH